MIICGDHSEVKRQWRTLTDQHRAWPALRSDAISARCKSCGSHLIVYGDLEAGGGKDRACGAGAKAAPPPPASLVDRMVRTVEVFEDPEPTVTICVLPEVR